MRHRLSRDVCHLQAHFPQYMGPQGAPGSKGSGVSRRAVAPEPAADGAARAEGPGLQPVTGDAAV